MRTSSLFALASTATFSISLFLSLVLTSCKTDPQQPQIDSAPPVVEALPELKWGKDDWTRELMHAIRAEGLTALRPSDAAQFAMDPKNETHWAKILVEMAKYESNFKPLQTYAEAFADAQGRRVVSTGLFQISIESSNARGCGFKSQDELLDPRLNIKCAVKIFAYWVKRDGRIAGIGPSQWRGGARYWAVLRGTTRHTEKALAAIQRANE